MYHGHETRERSAEGWGGCHVQVDAEETVHEFGEDHCAENEQGSSAGLEGTEQAAVRARMTRRRVVPPDSRVGWGTYSHL